MKKLTILLFSMISNFIFLSVIHAGNYPGMRVIDRFLYTKQNEKVILRGINQMIIWLDKEGSRSYKEIAKTGANSVRIVWLTTGKPDELDQAIRNCVREKMIPIIELHDATGVWSKLNQCVEYWLRGDVIKVIQKHQKYLLINIANEPGESGVTGDEFEKTYKDAVRKMRSAGIHVPLIIDPTDWGKNIDILQDRGFNLIADDPDHNLMFSIHMWWPLLWGYDDIKVKNEIEESVNMHLPLIVGEFGNKWDETPAGVIPYRTIIEECEKNEIGWLAWSWGPGNNPQKWLDMSTNGTFNTLQDWGLDVAVTNQYSIKNTAERPQSFGGTVKPQTTPDPDSWIKNKDEFDKKKVEAFVIGQTINALKAKNKIILNGDLNEWYIDHFKENAMIKLNKDTGFINAGKIESDADFNAVIYLMHDDQNLYIAAKVTDDNLRLESQNGDNWKNDCIEIWIDAAADKGTMTDSGGNDPDNYQLNIDANGNPWLYRNNNAESLLKKINAVSKIDKTNYTLEIQIPFECMPEFDLKKNNRIGFDISFVDSDNISRFEWNHILWQGKKENDPNQWGILIFE